MNKNLTINGQGASSLTISSNNSSRCLLITSGTVTIFGMTIANCQNSGWGGGIYNAGTLTIESGIIRDNNSPSWGGGGIFNSSNLTIKNSTISSNEALSGGKGGGIYNLGTLTIVNSTIDLNTAGPATVAGGGIAHYSGSLTINNSTISGNVAIGAGGGVWSQAQVTLANVTITGNEARPAGSPPSGYGGGIRTERYAVDFKNTIIAGNTAAGNSFGPDCSNSSHAGSNGVMNSQDYNLIQNTSDCIIVGTTSNNITGQAPLLGSLNNNGGDTMTHALQANSPAIDKIPIGTNDCAAGNKDQRSALRANGANQGGSTCDIGAYETSSTFVKDVTGSGTYYLHKALIKVTTQGTLSKLSALHVSSNHPNATTGIQTGQYWTFTPTGSGFTLNMTLPHNTTPDSGDKVCRYTGTGQEWNCAATSFDTGNNTITRNGITQLSDWATGENVPTAVTLQSLTARTDTSVPVTFIHVGSILFLCLISGIALGLAFGFRRKHSDAR